VKLVNSIENSVLKGMRQRICWHIVLNPNLDQCMKLIPDSCIQKSC
jgi:hypothetical protein